FAVCVCEYVCVCVLLCMFVFVCVSVCVLSVLLFICPQIPACLTLPRAPPQTCPPPHRQSSLPLPPHFLSHTLSLPHTPRATPTPPAPPPTPPPPPLSSPSLSLFLSLSPPVGSDPAHRRELPA